MRDGYNFARILASYALIFTVGYGIGHYNGRSDQFKMNTEECKAFVDQKVTGLKYDIQKEMDLRMKELEKSRSAATPFEAIEQKVSMLYRALFP